MPSAQESGIHTLEDHIHHLLDVYVERHVTGHYTEWAQAQVYKILLAGETLATSSDSHELAIPTDPLTTFVQTLPTASADFIVDHLQITGEAYVLLKGTISRPESAHTDLCFDMPSNFDVLPHKSEFSRWDTALCRRSRLLVPRLGQHVFLSQFADRHSGFSGPASLDLPPVYGESIPALDINVEDALQLRLNVDPEAKKLVLLTLSNSLPQSVASGDFPQHTAPPSMLLKSPSSPLPLRPMTPPILPRTRRLPGSASTGEADMPAFKDVLNSIAPVKPFTMEEEDPTLEQLVMVDGWDTFAIPSSPLIDSTPSLVDSSSEVDELFLMSPQTSPPFRAVELETAKLDDYVLPRERHRRSEVHLHRLQGEGMPLQDYLHTFSMPQIRSNPGSRPSSPSHDIASSAAALTSTMVKGGIPAAGLPDSDEYFDHAIHGLHRNLGNAFAFVLSEQPSDRAAELMEVPVLLEPNQHAKANTFPSSLRSLYTSGFLQPVKGLKPLNLELSWRPFDFRDEVPNHDELARTSGLHEVFRPDLPCSVDQQDVRRVLTRANGVRRTHNVSVSDMGGSFLTASPRRNVHLSALQSLADGIILSRAETLKVKGFSEPMPVVTNYGAVKLDLQNPTSSSLPKKRRKVSGNASDLCNPRSPSEVPSTLLAPRSKQVLVSPSLSTRPSQAQSPDEGSSGSLPVVKYSDDCEQVQEASTHQDEADFFEPLALDSQPTNYGISYTQQPTRSSPLILPDSSIPSSSSFDLEMTIASLHTPYNLILPSQRTPMSSLVDFLEIRGRRTAEVEPEYIPLEPLDQAPTVEIGHSVPFFTPDEVMNDYTLILPNTSISPASDHTILASLEFMHNRQLLKSLAARRIHVTERDTLGGADLVLSCELAIVTYPLAHLPSRCDELKACLDTLSWNFASTLVIFEAFAVSGFPTPPHAFTPPVIKAIKRLHRKISISEAYKTRAAESVIAYAYAESCDQVADYVLFAGEGALGRGWSDDGSWLLEEQGDEGVLASVPGMNAFAAADILSQVSLDDLIAMAAEQRQAAFSSSIGIPRIERLNTWFSSREIYLSASDDFVEEQTT